MGYEKLEESHGQEIYPNINQPSYTYAIVYPNLEVKPSAPYLTEATQEMYPSYPYPTAGILSQPVSAENGEWKHSFCCGSCSDCADCFLAAIFPSLYACFLAKDMGKSTCFACLNCLFFPLCLCCLRSETREKHRIEGGICCDILTTQCCPCCAMIQMKKQYRSNQ